MKSTMRTQKLLTRILNRWRKLINRAKSSFTSTADLLLCDNSTLLPSAEVGLANIANPTLLVIEELIKRRIHIQQLLQICPGIGTGVADGKSGRCQTASPGIPRDHHPVLTAIGITDAEQDRFSLLQLSINGAEIPRAVTAV